MSADKSSLCSCDEHCRTLGDCCVDAHFHCFGAKPEETHMLLPNDSAIANALTTSMKCMPVNFVGRDENGQRQTVSRNYDMIAICPVGSEGDKQCLGIGSVLHATPVCLPRSHLIFKNIYCLLCHGFSKEEAVAFNVETEKYTHFSVPNECKTSADRMQCPKWFQVRGQTCPPYKNPVVIKDTGFTFKNQFCAFTMHADIQCLTYDDQLYSSNLPWTNHTIAVNFMDLLNFKGGNPIERISLGENGNDNRPGFSRVSFNKFDLIQFSWILLFLQATFAIIYVKLFVWTSVSYYVVELHVTASKYYQMSSIKQKPHIV